MADEDLVADACDLLGDGAVVEVDVAPPQADRLAAAQAAQGDQPPQGVEPVGGDVVEERGEVFSGPHGDGCPDTVVLLRLDPLPGPHDSVWAGSAGQFDAPGGVVGDHVATDGGVERAAQGGANAVQCRRGEAVTRSGGLLCEVGKHSGEVPDSDLGEAESAEMWNEVLLHVLGVDPSVVGRIDVLMVNQYRSHRPTVQRWPVNRSRDWSRTRVAAAWDGNPLRRTWVELPRMSRTRQSNCRLPCPRSTSRGQVRFRRRPA
ncbi:hypothetical protein ACQEVZ_27700 [Dactylosporangium sp. CA-152071]|uniref:hypothetical protein n=1 Tax=Dactylosporangium sp. CA-152071 TaxID=3239933 RepID=UPI003D91E762